MPIPDAERDRRVTELHLAGVKQKDIAVQLGVSPARVSSIMWRLGLQVKFDPTDLVNEFAATGQAMRAKMIEIADQEPPPAFTKDGVMLVDDRTGAVVVDRAAQMAAVAEERAQRRETARILGLDAPKRVELEQKVIRHIIDGVDADDI